MYSGQVLAKPTTPGIGMATHDNQIDNCSALTNIIYKDGYANGPHPSVLLSIVDSDTRRKKIQLLAPQHRVRFEGGGLYSKLTC